MITPPKTLVFDLDGTLADTAPDIIATLNAILASLGHPTLPDQHAIEMVGNGARALLAAGLKAAKVPFDQRLLDKLFVQFLAHYEKHIADKTQLYPGVIAALDRLANDGFIFAVCTNKMEHHAKLLLEKLGIKNRFSAICGRDSFPFLKPDPRHLTMTITQAGGHAEHAIMVGDSGTDINTAKNAKVPVVAVNFGYSETSVRLLDPDVVIEHYDHLYEAVIMLTKTHLQPMSIL